MSIETDPDKIDRAAYIGGSDAAAILGRSLYRTPMDVWRVKVGASYSDFNKDNLHIRRGNYTEPMIEQHCQTIDPSLNARHQFEQYCPDLLPTFDDFAAGKRPRPAQLNMMHPDLPYVGGHPDGVGDIDLWEFKSPAPRNFEMYCKTGFPGDWLYQMCHYAWIYGKKRMKLAMWDFNAWEPYVVEFVPSPKAFALFERIYPVFWDAVQNETPYEPQIDAQVIKFLNDDALEQLAYQYRDQTEIRYASEAAQKRLKGEMLTALGGAEHYETDNLSIGTRFVDTKFGGYYKIAVKDKNLNTEEDE